MIYQKMYTVIMIVAGATVLYAFFAPVFCRTDVVLSLLRPNCLENVKDYYSLLCSFVTILIGLLGLALGFRYFVKRLEYESANRKRDQIRGIIDVLIERLEFIDKECNKILTNCGECVDNKDLLVANIRSNWNAFTSVLDNYATVLRFDKSHIRGIIEVFSIVDKDILSKDVAKLEKTELGNTKVWYNFLLRKARDILYSRYLENIG